MNLPKKFEEKMKDLLHEQYADYLACFDEPYHYGLRVNTNKITVEDFLKIAPWPLAAIPWINNGFYYDGENIQPAKHAYYFAGLYYLQEPSAMTPANRLLVEPGERVLDVCAAPGGKATELGAKLGGEGVLIANDISSSRAKGLLKNLELFGIGNMLVLSEDPGKLMNYFHEYFDKILIDAPCSGEGMFRKDKKMVKAWQEHGPEFFTDIQRGILAQAAQMLRPGGKLLYSTCTFDPLENEQAISELLKLFPEFEICEIVPYDGFAEGMPSVSACRNPELSKTVRMFPHRIKGEGHYLALLRKGSAAEVSLGTEIVNKKTDKIVKCPQELSDFLGNTTWNLDVSRLDIQGEKIYYMPTGLPELKGIRFLRSGLLLGQLKKNRFEPSQAFAMCLKKKEYKYTLDFAVEDARVMKYLRGDTLDVEDIVSAKEKGWYLICVDGYPLGFGKLAKQTLKNKYFPGWRCMF